MAAASPVRLQIPRVDLRLSRSQDRAASRKPFAVYEIEVENKRTGAKWIVFRRYSEFYTLHRDIRRSLESDLAFPKKKTVGNKKPEFIEQRRVQLQRYLQMVVLIPGILMTHPEIGNFLNFDENDVTLDAPEIYSVPTSGDKRDHHVYRIERRPLFVDVNVYSMQTDEEDAEDEWAGTLPQRSSAFVAKKLARIAQGTCAPDSAEIPPDAVLFGVLRTLYDDVGVTVDRADGIETQALLAQPEWLAVGGLGKSAAMMASHRLSSSRGGAMVHQSSYASDQSGTDDNALSPNARRRSRSGTLDGYQSTGSSVRMDGYQSSGSANMRVDGYNSAGSASGTATGSVTSPVTGLTMHSSPPPVRSPALSFGAWSRNLNDEPPAGYDPASPVTRQLSRPSGLTPSVSGKAEVPLTNRRQSLVDASASSPQPATASATGSTGTASAAPGSSSASTASTTASSPRRSNHHRPSSSDFAPSQLATMEEEPGAHYQPQQGRVKSSGGISSTSAVNVNVRPKRSVSLGPAEGGASNSAERGGNGESLSRRVFSKRGSSGSIGKKKRSSRPISTMSIDVDLAVVASSDDDDDLAFDADEFGAEHSDPRFSLL